MRPLGVSGGPANTSPLGEPGRGDSDIGDSGLGDCVPGVPGFLDFVLTLSRGVIGPEPVTLFRSRNDLLIELLVAVLKPPPGVSNGEVGVLDSDVREGFRALRLAAALLGREEVGVVIS